VIDLLPNDDQAVIVEVASSMLAKTLPRSRLRAMLRDGQQQDRGFMLACGGLGWLGMTLPESYGGSALSLCDEALLFRELGRVLAPGPFLGTVMAGKIAFAAENAQLARDIANGKAIACSANRAEGRLVVFDSGPAELLVAVDLAGQDLGVYDASAVSFEARQPSIDPFYDVAWVAEPLGPPVIRAAPAGLLGHAVVLLAAYLCGLAEAALADAVAYASARTQYGQPIGAFQAVKHRCADMAVRCELAWAQTAMAALDTAAGEAGAVLSTSAAAILAADAAVGNARASIQVHGGIGYTAEHDAHLLLKRAHIQAHAIGTRSLHLSRILGAPRSW
jgi:alkylation response protein AidB-like acyl-CoA dehydrogenase